MKGTPDPVTVQLEKQDQPDGAWTVVQSKTSDIYKQWHYDYKIVVNQIANGYRVREKDHHGKVLEDENDVPDDREEAIGSFTITENKTAQGRLTSS